MKVQVAVAAALLLGISGSIAAADDVVVAPGNGTTVVSPDVTGSTTVIAPEQEHVIREYVKKEPLASINILGLDLSIGSKVPETVELHQIEAPDVQYRYAVVNDHTVVVDPNTRQVIEVIN